MPFTGREKVKVKVSSGGVRISEQKIADHEGNVITTEDVYNVMTVIFPKGLDGLRTLTMYAFVATKPETHIWKWYFDPLFSGNKLGFDVSKEVEIVSVNPRYYPNGRVKIKQGENVKWIEYVGEIKLDIISPANGDELITSELDYEQSLGLGVNIDQKARIQV
tara:strand:+ start:231 stop:719 length:489 start_codon:yes stop_codon:yes gene_type:complete